MIFILISIVVPLGLYFCLPVVIQKFTGKPAVANLTLILACFLFFISWYLPSPDIQGQYTAATTHFVGGGVFSGFLWLYLKQQLRWKASLLIELASLFCVVSALGVTMELVELTAVEAGLFNLPLTDTSWDLLMNSLGAGAFAVGYVLSKLKLSRGK